MWIKKNNNTMINLDNVESFFPGYTYDGKPALVLYHTNDTEGYIVFETKEKLDEVYNAIIHALGSEVCKIDAE